MRLKLVVRISEMSTNRLELNQLQDGINGGQDKSLVLDTRISLYKLN